MNIKVVLLKVNNWLHTGTFTGFNYILKLTSALPPRQVPRVVDFLPSSLVQVAKTLPAMQEIRETHVWSLGREDPLEEEMTTSPFFLLGKFHGYRSIQWAIVHGIAKCQTWLRDWANTPCDFIVCDSLAAAKLASWGIVPISGTLHDLLLHR